MKRDLTRMKFIAFSIAVLSSSIAASGADAQLAVQQRLAQIDRTFVCPESLANDEARESAINLFINQVGAVEPSITINEIVAYRMSLLKKHGCGQTLANIASSNSQAAASKPDPASHWVQAGRVGDSQNSMTITVDMDSMTGAGPGRMRTWIKYRNDKPDSEGVQESLVYEQLDCIRHLHSTMALVRYSPTGAVISDDQGSAEESEPIIPDSVLAGILPFTCAAHGLKAR
jgi:hypothetical protein